jgi:lipopolysaccharide export system protein LptA
LVVALGLAVLAPCAVPAQPAAPERPAARTGDGKARGERAQPVTVDADRMERFGKESLVIFTGNVIARQNSSVQHAERMEVYLDEKGERILRTVSTGSVRIVTRDCKTGTAARAEYFDLEQRMVLIGDARVWQDDNVVSGDTITIFLAQDRSVVQAGKQERVKAVFHPREQPKTGDQPQTVASKPPAGCEH